MSKKATLAPEKTFWQKSRLYVLIILLGALYVWSFEGLQFDLAKSLDSLDEAGRIVAGVFQPNIPFLFEEEGVLEKMRESLYIALLGTTIAAIIAVPFGFLAARNMSKKLRFVSTVGKRILNVIRTLPELIVAILFIVVVGPSPFAGVLAIGFHSIGMIGKLYSEAIENMEEGTQEALVAVGANRLQTLWFAVIPQVLPEFLSYALYKFEINVRAAAVLGMVGAGGIGTPLLFSLMGHTWENVGSILLVLVPTVILIDFISGSIRKRLV